jgi:predicted secreted protein
MADFKNGTDFVLFAKIAAAWVPLACLKTNAFDASTDSIDTTSKCSGKYKTSIPGDIGWSFSADGNSVDETGTPSRASFKKLSELHKAGTVFPMKMVGVNDATDIVRGDVYITALALSAGRNEAVGFTATFQGTGEYFTTVEAA